MCLYVNVWMFAYVWTAVLFESVYAEAEVDVNLLTALLSHSLRQHLSVQPRVHRHCLPPHLACSGDPHLNF